MNRISTLWSSSLLHHREKIGARTQYATLYAEIDTGKKPYKREMIYRSGNSGKVREVENTFYEYLQ